MTGARNACHAPSGNVTRDASQKSSENNIGIQSVQRTSADICGLCGTSDVGPVTAAAMWLVEQRGTLARPIAEVQQRFGLNAKQACVACALAARMRSCREAFA